MKFICPLITVTDMNRSRYFYENILNQKVKYDFGENVTYQGDFAIHLAPHFQTLIDNQSIKHGGNNFELYFELDELEPLIQKLEENKVLFVHELREQPWKQRVLRIYDPDRNIIEIGESMVHVVFRLKQEGLSDAEISEETSMPIEFVKKQLI